MSIDQSKKKIKIYIFHPYSGKGGADLSLSRLINGLNDKKYEIDFLSLNTPLIKKKFLKKLNLSRLIHPELYLVFLR